MKSDAGAAELMTTRELADYLRLNERTVLKLAGAGEIPGVRLGTQWRFRRRVIDAWLDDRMLGIRQPDAIPRPDPRTFSLADCFSPEHVVLELQHVTLHGALAELATRAAELGLVRDRRWFLGALLERESILSSAVGAGVAFPHTLERHPEQVARPFLLLGRSTRGIAFEAPDDVPVNIVLVMGLRFEELHLPWLARLSSALRRRRARSDILAAQDEAAVYAAIARNVDG